LPFAGRNVPATGPAMDGRGMPEEIVSMGKTGLLVMGVVTLARLR
jgi:hypothetical protein